MHLYISARKINKIFSFCWQFLTFKIPPQHKGRRPPHGLVLRSAAQVAKAMAGMHHFPPLRPFEPGAASALMATLLIHDLANPEGVRGTQTEPKFGVSIVTGEKNCRAGTTSLLWVGPRTPHPRRGHGSRLFNPAHQPPSSGRIPQGVHMGDHLADLFRPRAFIATGDLVPPPEGR